MTESGPPDQESCHPRPPNTKRAALGWRVPSDGEAALSPGGHGYPNRGGRGNWRFDPKTMAQAQPSENLTIEQSPRRCVALTFGCISVLTLLPSRGPCDYPMRRLRKIAAISSL